MRKILTALALTSMFAVPAFAKSHVAKNPTTTTTVARADKAEPAKMEGDAKPAEGDAKPAKKKSVKKVKKTETEAKPAEGAPAK